MKKLALGIATLLFAATPALACPEGGHGEAENTTKTADKAKKQDKAKDAKGQEKDKAAKPKTDDSKTAKPKTEPKKDDKVSQK